MKKILRNSQYKIFTAPLVATCKSNLNLKRKENLNELDIIKNGAVTVKDKYIVEVGQYSNIFKRWKSRSTEVIKFKEGILLPGFVDPHTHVVFGGSRVDEFYQRLSGKSYQEIHASGGGILNTVKKTRQASHNELYEKAKKISNWMLNHGTTSLEVKSGYGLDIKNEIKILEVIKKLKKNTPQNIYSTFLGAHAIPEEYKNNKDSYVDLLIGILPEIKKNKLAEFVDVFCEKGAFSLKETKKIMEGAQKEGFKLKIHAEEFEHQGGTSLAVSLKAISADHLMQITTNDIKQLSESSTVAVLLPGATYFLGYTQYAPARKLIDAGAAVALATDFNAGSCHTFSMQMILSLACFKMEMSIEEAINAATINAAFALGHGDKIGSLEAGKMADMILVDIDDIRLWPFYFGTNLVKCIVKSGKILRACKI